MDSIAIALGRLEDPRACAEKLRESLSDAPRNHELANDVAEVC